MSRKLLPILTVLVLLFPKLIFSQAPYLGSAASFVLFSSNGAVSNTGLSHLIGNVGTNNGSSTGFGNVNGVMHDDDGASSLCATDLLNAYNQLKNEVPTAFPAPLLGNGDTLNAGIYAIAGNTTLDSTLTLDAKGDANAVFVFQIQAAFSSTVLSKIILINGAQACNVFWKIEGLVSLASGTIMKGTVIANNAAINMSTGVSLEGRALSTTGAVTVSGVTAYTPTGCGSPLLTGPVAPVLGSSACYALFSGNGEVSNGGVTHVTGDVGTNVGLTSGFDPLTVMGTIHPKPDTSTAKCAADLNIAYGYLNILPYDIELLYPAQFGNSLTLTPHTYFMNAATTFTDTVFLDAENDSNAVFVIKVNGAFTTTPYATVVLLNGAQANNVFWKIEGAVNINTYSNFAGTIVCNNGAISLKTGAVLNGRALTTNGALSTAAITASITSSGGCNVLPVSWLYFRGTPVQKNVLLEWGTANETNTGFFTIEKSMDGERFTRLATVNAAGGNVTAKYAYTDLQPYNVAYYRISQTDKDGRKNYFGTIQVKFIAQQIFKAVNYIKGDFIYVQTSGAAAGNGSLELYNLDGKKISSQQIVLTGEVNNYKIAKPGSKGIYLLNIESGGKKLYYGKVIVL